MSMPADFESLQPEGKAFVRDRIDKQVRGDEDWNVTRKETSEAITEATKEAAYDFKGTRGEITIPSPHVKAGLPAWVYTPANCPKNPPILVYFHGGGWVICTLDDVDTFLKMLTDTANCIIVSVDYRLAPEHKYPAAIDDAETAAKWVLGNKESVGGSKLSKVGVIGDSAGGHLSACVSHDVPGIAFQLLIYPVTDMRIDTRESYKRYAEGYVLTTESMYWFVNHFLHNEAERSDPRASPILRTKFDHLPPALYVAATHDVLFDEGMEYAKKLKEAGVTIETLMLEGITHCTVNFPNYYKETYAMTCRKIAEFVKKHSE
ncbi:AB hydrolase superfamily protein C1039.03 [Lingula anatina]|uniref:AB hydrolase superfamily protein C1039.03 n=1 Tax=Lingula anatina TaxID=7574 RepID=A0A1S3K7X9_LINAN|nr:AB hydrolase superfamily protein C1039.03 [Lingula anatina]XP_013418733.1 AB hydrolase superfamily protein C1039.03 [Lingula anatina]|eukprot:XP_013418732.1 AB hydrolase superfamily protein C1039.03 [Lingula anatina]